MTLLTDYSSYFVKCCSSLQTSASDEPSLTQCQGIREEERRGKDGVD